MRKNTFRSVAQIKKHLGAQRDSGLSSHRYCKLHDIKNSTFRNWRKKYPEPQHTRFAQIVPLQLNTTPSIELKAGGFWIFVKNGCNELTLRSVLKTVLSISSEGGAKS